MYFISVNIEARWIQAGELPFFTGSMFRGTFGHVFKKTVCVRDGNCDHCHLKHGCAYSLAFETPAPPKAHSWFQRYPKVPHPFAFSFPVGGRVVEGQPFTIGLKLFGPTARLLPFFIYSIIKQGESGVGREELRFEVVEVLDSHAKILCKPPDKSLLIPDDFLDVQPLPPEPPHGYEPLRVRFISPCRIASQGRILGNFRARPVATGILRRYSALMALHGGEGLDMDFKAWAEACDQEGLQFFNKTKPMRVTRYSNRQKRRHEFHGFTGEVTFEKCPAALAQVLRVGEVLQVGKSTAFGFGVTETMNLVNAK